MWVADSTFFHAVHPRVHGLPLDEDTWRHKNGASYMNPCTFLNLLKPTGYVMHQQFNIQQLYALPTLYLCVSYLSEDKQRLVPVTA